MPKRFIFRQVCSRDLATFLHDGEIRAKNHRLPQHVHQTSYQTIVATRGTPMFALPHGGVVNDYVPFYFSPLTGFTHTIHRRNVDLRDPHGNVLGKASDDERIFFVCAVKPFGASSLHYCFSDLALNTGAPMPTVDHNLANLKTHVAWSMFDEAPLTAQIPEVGYGGVCEYFFSRATPARYQNRSKQRMAEFLVKDAVPLSMVDCIVVRDQAMKQELDPIVHASRWTIPIYVKPGCYFR